MPLFLEESARLVTGLLVGFLTLQALAAQTVVEYFDPDQNNYFITADPAEQAFVDSGAVGRWLRTGNSFATGGPNPVCRFYGNGNINPATGTIYGPNSHFYTADPTECAGLKAIYTPNAKSWKFESNDFLTTPPVAGACAAGLVPVYRAYNNGFARGIDSNHRITSNLTAIQQIVACGWINEGVVMCAPAGTTGGGVTNCGGQLPSPTVFVSIDESANWPISPGFAGFNFTTAYSAVSYLDASFQRSAATMAPGWLRYVGGTSSLAFNWATALMQDSWVSQFLNYGDADTLQTADYLLKGKVGGARIDDMNTFAKAVGASGMIVCVNGLTDTAVSAGNLATYVVQHDIPVLVWELSNEPYLFTSPASTPLPVPAPFFKNATDYLNKMAPFGATIRSAIPGTSSLVAVFVSDAGSPKKGPNGNLNASGTWDQAISSYATKYWDAIALHHYPTTVGATNPDGSVNPNLYVNKLNFVLLTATTAYVTDYLAPLVGSGTPIIISEFGPQSGNGDGGVLGTLYGGVYAAEYVIRMAKAPQVKYVGMHQLLSPGGISYTNNSIDDLVKRTGANGGTPIATAHPPNNDFGYFLSAQGIGYGLATSALASASLAVQTSVTGGGSVNTLDATQARPVTGTMPAVYAQAFSRSGKQTILVITNKGSQTEVAAIADVSRAPTAAFSVTTVSSPYWDLKNSSATTGISSSAAWSGPALAAESSNVAGNIIVPPYSVVVVRW